MDAEFVKYLRIFVEKLFTPEFLNIKVYNNEQITCEQLYHNFEVSSINKVQNIILGIYKSLFRRIAGTKIMV